MIRRLALIVPMILLAAQAAVGQVTKQDIDTAIDKNTLEHPYLYFSKADVATMRERAKTDRETGDILNRLVAEADRLIYTPVDYVIPYQGRNTRAGWTDADRNGDYDRHYNSSRGNAFTLAFVYQITGDEKYAKKAFEFADVFCDLPSWTMRAHEFPIIYSRIMPWNVPDDQPNFNFDHYNGDSARMMAAVYDWLYPALSVAQRDRIRGALIGNAITRVRGDYEYHWWAVAYRCNWCGVCNSGLGLAALALLTEDPQLTDVVAESYNRIGNMLSELGVDGDWQEGGGYWNYGVETSTFFADALNRATNGRFNLFNNKRLADNPVTFAVGINVAGTGALKFEDSGAGRLGDTYLINKLATETRDPVAAWYRANYFGDGDDIFDIIWPRPADKGKAPSWTSIKYGTIQWFVLRSDFTDTEKVTVAGKAGYNDDPHHGHLDCGQFEIHWRGNRYIEDIGSGSYDEKYFDDLRWNYPQANSEGHNVVSVNGEQQIPAKMRREPWKEGIGGDILDFRTSNARDYVLMDPTNAYPKQELKKWRRHIVLDKPLVTVVLDEVSCDRGDEIEARFHQGVDDVTYTDDYALLKARNGTMALIPAVEGDFTFRQGRHACQPVNATRNFFWINYFGTVVKASGTDNLVGTIVVPVADGAEAQRIADSVKLQRTSGGAALSFVQNGKTFSYTYEKGKDGLVLAK